MFQNPALLAFALAISVPARAADETYVPTRLEWLALQGHSLCGLALGAIPTVAWRVVPNAQKSAIVIEARFGDDAAHADARKGADACEKLIQQAAVARGWSVKTGIDVAHKDPNRNAPGFKITGIQKNGLYQKLGIKEGDVIKSINGKPVLGAQDVTELQNLIKSADKIELELVRDGAVRKLIFQMR